MSVDGYLIEIDDRITFTRKLYGSQVAAFLQSQGINANGGRYFTNAMDTRNRGLDIILRYGTRMGQVRLVLRQPLTYRYGSYKPGI